jgi:hypothetical protein
VLHGSEKNWHCFRLLPALLNIKNTIMKPIKVKALAVALGFFAVSSAFAQDTTTTPSADTSMMPSTDTTSSPKHDSTSMSPSGETTDVTAMTGAAVTSEEGTSQDKAAKKMEKAEKKQAKAEKKLEKASEAVEAEAKKDE